MHQSPSALSLILYSLYLPHQEAFNPRLLAHGSRIALDGTALVAFLADAKGAGKHLEPLMQKIGAGYWIGVVSSLSLMRVLQGPLARADEALGQTGLHPVLSALRT